MPWRATAPGPGRLAAESTAGLKLGGMQKMLTRVCGRAGPPVTIGPSPCPVSTMVRAMSLAVKAPELPCPQLLKGVAAVQSAFPLAGLQGTGRHLFGAHVLSAVQVAPVGEPLHLRANWVDVLLRQNPQGCTSDGDCGFSCEQSLNGAFAHADADAITEVGEAAGDLTDGAQHSSTLVSVFCIPPAYDSTTDTNGGLPGPGAVSLPGMAQLLP